MAIAKVLSWLWFSRSWVSQSSSNWWVFPAFSHASLSLHSSPPHHQLCLPFSHSHTLCRFPALTNSSSFFSLRQPDYISYMSLPELSLPVHTLQPSSSPPPLPPPTPARHYGDTGPAQRQACACSRARICVTQELKGSICGIFTLKYYYSFRIMSKMPKVSQAYTGYFCLETQVCHNYVRFKK